MATHSRILAWRILWTEEPGGLHGVTKSQTRLSTHAISTTLTSSSPASCRPRHLSHFSIKTCHWLPCNNVKTLLGGFQSYFHVGCTCHVVASSPPSQWSPMHASSLFTPQSQASTTLRRHFLHAFLHRVSCAWNSVLMWTGVIREASLRQKHCRRRVPQILHPSQELRMWPY